jgi:hypothetical protein
MPRAKKPSAIKDIYLAGKVQGFALQINVQNLERYLEQQPAEFFSFTQELRATIAYAKQIQGNHHANINQL